MFLKIFKLHLKILQIFLTIFKVHLNIFNSIKFLLFPQLKFLFKLHTFLQIQKIILPQKGIFYNNLIIVEVSLILLQMFNHLMFQILMYFIFLFIFIIQIQAFQKPNPYTRPVKNTLCSLGRCGGKCKKKDCVVINIGNYDFNIFCGLGHFKFDFEVEVIKNHISSITQLANSFFKTFQLTKIVLLLIVTKNALQ